MTDVPYTRFEYSNSRISHNKDRAESDAELYLVGPPKPQTKKKPRAKLLAEPWPKEKGPEVWALCLAGEIRVDQVRSTEFLAISKAPVSREVVVGTLDEKLVFFFRFGCVVGWGLNDAERERVRDSLRGQKPGCLDKPLELSKQQEDDLGFNESNAVPMHTGGFGSSAALGVLGRNKLVGGDCVFLETDSLFEKLAHSYALAQSVKLDVFEDVCDSTIDATKNVIVELADTGKIKYHRAEISRRIGELFMNRFYINLHTDILDTPDVFWDKHEYEKHYAACRTYLEIHKRVDVLNQRLDIIKDLYDMLNNELKIQHGYKLEWIVIYLVLIEVFIEVVWNIIIKDLLKLV
eukprot:GHVU01061301.1.p1 GENE.GHVU01061301.1~~GHVU01061301.1.p1  ORF type:complete len:349 (-),score=76.11 GHVU01061301.1:116-1162(-)